jgi:hypothetical protein
MRTGIVQCDAVERVDYFHTAPQGGSILVVARDDPATWGNLIPAESHDT